MKLFTCPNCSARLYFENGACLACGVSLRYDPHRAGFLCIDETTPPACANLETCGCNWIAAGNSPFCLSCGLNKTIPDLSLVDNQQRWIRAERAKKRAVYSLLALGLPVAPKAEPGDEVGLAFDLLADPVGAGPGGERILTGHDNGLITLNVAEADSAERERRRIAMGENYRTLLGHFRHELGHYYWDRLVRDDADWLARFRDLFGDETFDYEQALRNHYGNGAPPDWQSRHISAYAASHPWEDWAESWAHYLHITDTLEMVQSLGMQLGQIETVDDNTLAHDDRGGDSAGGTSSQDTFATILERWLVLSEASNSINRCMGLPDLYPFVISDPAAAKLRFVHELLTAKGT